MSVTTVHGDTVIFDLQWAQTTSSATVSAALLQVTETLVSLGYENPGKASWYRAPSTAENSASLFLHNADGFPAGVCLLGSEAPTSFTSSFLDQLRQSKSDSLQRPEHADAA